MKRSKSVYPQDRTSNLVKSEYPYRHERPKGTNPWGESKPKKGQSEYHRLNDILRQKQLKAKKSHDRFDVDVDIKSEVDLDEDFDIDDKVSKGEVKPVVGDDKAMYLEFVTTVSEKKRKASLDGPEPKRIKRENSTDSLLGNLINGGVEQTDSEELAAEIFSDVDTARAEGRFIIQFQAIVRNIFILMLLIMTWR